MRRVLILVLAAIVTVAVAGSALAQGLATLLGNSPEGPALKR